MFVAKPESVTAIDVVWFPICFWLRTCWLPSVLFPATASQTGLACFLLLSMKKKMSRGFGVGDRRPLLFTTTKTTTTRTTSTTLILIIIINFGKTLLLNFRFCLRMICQTRHQNWQWPLICNWWLIQPYCIHIFMYVYDISPYKIFQGWLNLQWLPPSNIQLNSFHATAILCLTFRKNIYKQRCIYLEGLWPYVISGS